jgi:hypothetical protein
VLEQVRVSCTQCNGNVTLSVPKEMSDKDVIEQIRSKGWAVTNNGSRAKCPKCCRPVPTDDKKAEWNYSKS